MCCSVVSNQENTPIDSLHNNLENNRFILDSQRETEVSTSILTIQPAQPLYLADRYQCMDICLCV